MRSRNLIREPSTPINSLILRTATRLVFSLMLLLSVFLLLRGHNEPGGGFIGGLVAAIGFILYSIAYDTDSARKILHVQPRMLIAIGLLVAAAGGIIGLAFGDPILTSHWASFNAPLFGHTSLGSPLVFDIGVYLVVIGVVLTIVLSIMEN
jgi:multicomponent Na+:H+ antiporter subunit B